MGVVAIRCPRTGREVSTGVEIDRDGFHSLKPVIFRMRCEACGSEHVWSRGTARLLEGNAIIPEERRPPPARPRDILDRPEPEQPARASRLKEEPEDVFLGGRFANLAARLLKTDH